MRCTFDHDLHIHSQISLCSIDPGQTNERILEYAKRNNLKTICLTDHFWDSGVSGASDWYKKQDFDHISAAEPLPQTDGIRFLFGCETEMDKNMTIGISKQCFDNFDFVIIPTTHFHMTGVTIPETVTEPEQKAELWLKRLNALLDMELPFEKIGIPHLTCPLMDGSREKYLKIIDSLSTQDLKTVFKKAAERGAGIELNQSDMQFESDEAETILRPYKIAKEMGCKFYFGSDAHHPSELSTPRKTFERTVALLQLTEDNKFHIKERK